MVQNVSTGHVYLFVCARGVFNLHLASVWNKQTNKQRDAKTAEYFSTELSYSTRVVHVA